MSLSRPILLLTLLLASTVGGCQSPAPAGSKANRGNPAPAGPIRPVDHLIEKHEVHFKHLWQLTSGGENTRPRWSPDGQRIAYQFSDLSQGIECERIRTQELETGRMVGISDGRGIAFTGGYLTGSPEFLFASTHGSQKTCPPPPDQALGYVWPLDPALDLYSVEIPSGAVRRLVDSPEFDGHPSVAPETDRIVFCSRRSGDPDLWTCGADGSDLVQLTKSEGFEATPQWSPDGRRIAFSATAFDPDRREAHLAEYRGQLDRHGAAPSPMEIAVVDADGSNRRTVISPGKANWDPCFTPDGERILFVSNHHGQGQLATSYDLFLVDLDGSNLERVTFFDGDLGRQFDGFPSFSPDGRYLAFSSNRGPGEIGETNVFIAEWQ